MDAETSNVTLSSLLAKMQAFEEGLIADFDPKDLVGDLKDKIDAVKYVIDRFEFQAAWCREQAQPFVKGAQTLEKRARSLKDYVVFAMQQHQFPELPGQTYRAKLQNNPPALQITQKECTAMDFQKYPNYVSQVRYYEWNKEMIKEALTSKFEFLKEADETLASRREFQIDEIPFAKLTIDQQVRFPLNKPEKLKK